MTVGWIAVRLCMGSRSYLNHLLAFGPSPQPSPKGRKGRGGLCPCLAVREKRPVRRKFSKDKRVDLVPRDITLHIL